jgi:ABC-type glutathione transport system ATPase component
MSDSALEIRKRAGGTDEGIAQILDHVVGPAARIILGVVGESGRGKSTGARGAGIEPRPLPSRAARSVSRARICWDQRP